MSKDNQIIIVGGGPAGASTAIAAARNGAKVTIVDRKTNIGIPVQCGESVPVN
ncbi:MAG: FAD-dependent oxidoreductase [Promethearchaeota archaeon]